MFTYCFFYCRKSNNMEKNVPYIEIVPECSDVTGTDESIEEADSKGMCKL